MDLCRSMHASPCPCKITQFVFVFFWWGVCYFLFFFPTLLRELYQWRDWSLFLRCETCGRTSSSPKQFPSSVRTGFSTVVFLLLSPRREFRNSDCRSVGHCCFLSLLVLSRDIIVVSCIFPSWDSNCYNYEILNKIKSFPVVCTMLHTHTYICIYIFYQSSLRLSLVHGRITSS